MVTDSGHQKRELDLARFVKLVGDSGFTLTQVADKSGVSRLKVSRLYWGRLTGVNSPTDVAALAEVLGTTYEELTVAIPGEGEDHPNRWVREARVKSREMVGEIGQGRPLSLEAKRKIRDILTRATA